MNRHSLRNEYHYLDQPRPVNLWRLLFDFVLITLTIALAAALLMAYFSTGISPIRNWVFAFFGLGAPFLFLANFILLLLWVIRWRLWFLIPFLTLLIGWGHLRALVQVKIGRDYHTHTPAARRPPGELTVMSYNVHGFSRGQTEHAGYLRTLESVAAYAVQERLDVICFQEYETMSDEDVRRVQALFQEWPYQAFNFVIGSGSRKLGYGTAIFSRLPLLNAQSMVFEGSANSMIYADVLLEGDTIRVFNNHLQSTQIDETSQTQVEQLDVAGGGRGAERFVRSLGSRLRANYRRRATQVDAVASLIAATPHPIIVAGDFNDTPVSYTYKRMRGDLSDSFIEAGSGFAYTYNRLFSMLRIDYLFYSSDTFEALNYTSDNLPWSDHNPVVVRLRLRSFGE